MTCPNCDSPTLDTRGIGRADRWCSECHRWYTVCHGCEALIDPGETYVDEYDDDYCSRSCAYQYDWYLRMGDR